MTKQADFDGGTQSDVLTRFRVRSGKGRTQIAVDLGMEADTYRRYETGQTELRVSQVRKFAEAYGATSEDILRALGLLDDEAAGAGWDMATALRSHVPQADIPGLVAEHGHKPLADQQAAARGIIRNVHEAQRKATRDANQSA